MADRGRPNPPIRRPRAPARWSGYPHRKGCFPSHFLLKPFRFWPSARSISVEAKNGASHLGNVIHIPNSLLEAAQLYADPDTAWEFFKEIRWPGGVTCPFCGCERLSFLTTRK